MTHRSPTTAKLQDAPAAHPTDSDARHEFLGCLLFVAGSGIFYMMPAYLASVGGRLALDPAQLGLLAAVESLAIGISSLLGPLWIARVNRRHCLLGAAIVCAVGDAATAYGETFAFVLAARFLVGLLGEGALYTISCGVLGGVRKTDRAFAIALTAGVAFGAAVLAASATLERLFPAIGPLAPLILIALAVAPFTGWAPADAAGFNAAAGTAGRRPRNRSALLALVAQALWFGAPGAFWTFAEQVATDKGVPTATAELALSVGELASLVGSVLAAWVGDRWGRLGPIAGASFGMAASAIVYQYSAGAAMLGLVLSIFYGLWNFGTVYQMSLVSELDRTGRAAMVIPAAQVFGQSVGPFCAGRLMLDSGDPAVTLTSILFAAAGLCLYLVCYWNQGRPGRRAARTISSGSWRR
jgi:predicted MFS family arabinose efflux permease